MKGRLEREVEELVASGKHDPQIVPVFSRVALPRQRDFFDPREIVNRLKKDQLEFGDRPSPGVAPIYFANNVTLSIFYELMSASFYGGTVFNRRYVLNEKGRVKVREGQQPLNGFSQFESLIRFTKPDLIDERRHRITEVKSFRSGRSYKFRDEQMARYVDLQVSLPSDTVIEFVIYRHTVRDFSYTKNSPNKRYTERELFHALSQHTAHSVILPFNLICLLHDCTGKSGDVFRDEGKIKNPRTEAGAAEQYGNPGTCLRSSSANRILFEPEQFLQDHGQKLNDYEIQRTRSPDEFCFGVFGVNSFPITHIRYKHYGQWVEELKNKQPDTLAEFDTSDSSEPEKQLAENDTQGTLSLESDPF